MGETEESTRTTCTRPYHFLWLEFKTETISTASSNLFLFYFVGSASSSPFIREKESSILHSKIKQAMAITTPSNSSILLSLSLLLISLSLAESQSFIGVNYGQVADNLPAPEDTANLLKSTTIGKVRLYGADPAIIKALANSGIGIVIGAANGDIPSLAADPNAATQWVNANVLPYYPASNITLITVGNEILTLADQGLLSQLVPAMRNVQNALGAASLGGKIRVSTVHSMAVLTQSDPPSSGLFNPALQDTLKQLLALLKDNKSPFTINPYPFFAYQSDPRSETLAFCLFQPNSGRVDSGNGKLYTNMFDAQVDAVHSALSAMGFQDVEIVVAETGWPSRGDSNEVGPSVENAKAYNGNLIAHLRSLVGTPLMPGKSVDTYIFALYDEDLKPGPGSERAFGMFKTDRTVLYDVGLTKSSQQTPTTPVTPAPNTAGWCVAKAGVSDAQLQANIDYACSQGIDCGPIQPGGSCFEPNTIASHAAFAMNLYYQTSGKNQWNCDFSQSATLTSQNPSYNACIYTGGST
ncbi:Glucan endo-1,3-beta-glucosidase 7 [Glycine max]|nr:Glucan endo-1,3-beta-glucosidase 7 [Glycine max]